MAGLSENFNVTLLAVITAILAALFLYAIVFKLVADMKKNNYSQLFAKYSADLKAVCSPLPGAETKEVFERRLAEISFKQKWRNITLGKRREIFERALIQIINKDSLLEKKAREVGQYFFFAEDSIQNIKSKNHTRKLFGCQQAGVYLYKPAIPFIMNTLTLTAPNLQYYSLLALAEFKQADIIIKAFEVIGDNILVNERIAREIVRKMGDGAPALFREILKENSPILVNMFLQFIDKNNANLYLDKIKKLAGSDDVKTRVAAMNAFAQSRSSRALGVLNKALQDKEWSVRVAAADALGKIPMIEVREPLLNALSDSVYEVHKSAVAAVLTLPGRKRQLYLKQILEAGDVRVIQSLAYEADAMMLADVTNKIQKWIVQHREIEKMESMESVHLTNLRILQMSIAL